MQVMEGCVAQARDRHFPFVLGETAFYAWGEPVMVLVMLGSVGFNYLAALLIDRQAGRGRGWALALAAAANLLALAVFKYADFVLASAQAEFGDGVQPLYTPLQEEGEGVVGLAKKWKRKAA